LSKDKPFDKVDGLDSTTVAIAKLEAGGKCACEDKDNKTQVNEALLNLTPDVRSGWKPSLYVWHEVLSLRHLSF
jgi:hypothetical protein